MDVKMFSDTRSRRRVKTLALAAASCFFPAGIASAKVPAPNIPTTSLRAGRIREHAYWVNGAHHAAAHTPTKSASAKPAHTTLAQQHVEKHIKHPAAAKHAATTNHAIVTNDAYDHPHPIYQHQQARITRSATNWHAAPDVAPRTNDLAPHTTAELDLPKEEPTRVIGVAPPPHLRPRNTQSFGPAQPPADTASTLPAYVSPVTEPSPDESIADTETPELPPAAYSYSRPSSTYPHYAPPNVVGPQAPPLSTTPDTETSTATPYGPIAPTAPRLVGKGITPLYGSHEILLHQNEMADVEGLNRIQNDAELNRMRRSGQLMPLPVSLHLAVDPRLPANRRFARPWATKFLTDISNAFFIRFGEPLQVNSAVRTVEVQEHLVRINGNAAPAAGATASPHLTGNAVDIAKRDLSPAEIKWMREYLIPIEDAGKIDVEEEFQQSVFHISIYKLYAPPPVRRTVTHSAHTNIAATSAASRKISSQD